MSRAPCSTALRAQVAEALGHVMMTVAARALGRAVGHEGHTLSARGTDLGKWPSLDLLLVAADHDDLRQSLIACLMGTDAPPIGEPTQAIPEILESIDSAAEQQRMAVQILRDGRVSAGEARALRSAIEARRQQEDADLLPALRALEIR